MIKYKKGTNVYFPSLVNIRVYIPKSLASSIDIFKIFNLNILDIREILKLRINATPEYSTFIYWKTPEFSFSTPLPFPLAKYIAPQIHLPQSLKRNIL